LLTFSQLLTFFFFFFFLKWFSNPQWIFARVIPEDCKRGLPSQHARYYILQSPLPASSLSDLFLSM
jgi:hypothetical protein